MIVRAQEEADVIPELDGPSAKCDNILRNVARKRDIRLQRLQCSRESQALVGDAVQLLRTNAKTRFSTQKVPAARPGRSAVEPYHLKRSEELTSAIPQPVHVYCKLLRALRIGDQLRRERAFDVAGQILDAIVAHRDPEVLGRHVFELMGLVDDRVVARRDHLAERALTDGRVSAKQVVVDDDDVGGSGLLTHACDEALGELRTVRADAVFGAGGDLAPEAHVLGQVLDLGPVAGRRSDAPFVDHLDVVGVFFRPEGRAVAMALETMEAEIVAPSFHVGRRELDVQRFAEHRKILEKNLFLQVLRSG